MKKIVINTITCAVLAIATILVLKWNMDNRQNMVKEPYDDGIEQVDVDNFYLKDSNVKVNFSEVIIGEEKETRKLIVLEQKTTVSTQLSKSLIEKIDFDWMKKTQEVSYTGTGYFVVDLDKLTEKDIVEDEEKKIITIKIEHAYLEAIEINPNNIIIDEVKESLLAKGDIKLTVADYNKIEKELRKRLEEKFDNAKNGQKANEAALKMVKKVYEPIIKAIDSDYTVHIEFK